MGLFFSPDYRDVNDHLWEWTTWHIQLTGTSFPPVYLSNMTLPTGFSLIAGSGSLILVNQKTLEFEVSY